MPRALFPVVFGFAIFTSGLLAQEGPERGRIKHVDVEKGLIIVTAGDKDHELTVTPITRFMNADGSEIKEGLKDTGFKEGAEVMFRADRRDGKTVLAGMRLGGDNQRPGARADIRQAKIKSIDLEKMNLVLIVAAKDHNFAITTDTQVLGASGKDLKERLKDFKEGSEVQFRAGVRDGKDVVLGLKLAGGDDRPRQPSNDQPQLPQADTSKLKALTELGEGQYLGAPGGLYPGGKNERPSTHEAAGVALAQQVQPLDAEGKPSADGKTVLLSVGMSNTTQEFAAFKQIADADRAKSPHLIIVDGAQGGMAAAQIQDPDDNGTGSKFWSTVDQRLQSAGATRAQVQAAWIKQADIRPSQAFPKHTQILQAELVRIVQAMHSRFPNLKLVYVSSRTYGGYAKTPLNPEPYAYESAFAVKWLIEQQLQSDPALNYDSEKGPVTAPWLSWGPYLWANGRTKRADGFSYEERDFQDSDGTHPSPSGRQKVAQQLLQFFKSDSTTKGWFLATPSKTSADRALDSPQDPLFRLLDRNHDGRLSRDELKDAPELLEQFDKDGDEKLDRKELGLAGPRQGRPGEIITPAAKGERHKAALAVGDEAPNFTLPNPTGEIELTLSSFRDVRPVVLVFASYT